MDLNAAIGNNDFNSLVQSFGSDQLLVDSVTNDCRTISIWQTELDFLGQQNPALVFLREMHSNILSAIACISCSLYKPSVASMRAMLECSLYYTFFFHHPKELETLFRVPGYYISKSQTMNFHRNHTLEFGKKQEVFDLENKLELWYSKASQIVHGQIPENWPSLTDLSAIQRDSKADKKTCLLLSDASSLINSIFLCTIDIDDWNSITPKSRNFVTKGLNIEQKNILGLLN